MKKKFLPIEECVLTVQLGAKLKMLRKDAGLSIEAVCKGADVAPRAYADFERGIRLPRFDSLIKLCNFWELTPERMLDRLA